LGEVGIDMGGITYLAISKINFLHYDDFIY
jgi:hypothetical protein